MNFNKTILIGRTDYDKDTSYPFAWAEQILINATKNGWEVIDLPKEKFNREEIEKCSMEKNPGFIFLSGHGSPFEIFGHEKCVVFKINENENLTSGKYIYSVSCEAGKVIGKSMVEKGCSCFIGYYGVFSFIAMENKPKHIIKDKYAMAFMESSNEIPSAIIAGESGEKAYKKSQFCFNKWIKYWTQKYLDASSEKCRKDAKEVISALLLDRRSQVIYCR